MESEGTGWVGIVLKVYFLLENHKSTLKLWSISIQVIKNVDFTSVDLRTQ